MQVAVWAIWAILGGGALLTTLGLLNSMGRFREWKSAQGEHDGEIMLADRALEPGQQAQVIYPVVPCPLTARLTRLFRRTIQLALDTSASSASSIVWPPIGATVRITVTGTCEQFQFQARVCDVRPETEELVLSRPTWLARIQRRKHARTNTILPATFETASYATQALPTHGKILNLSGGGFRAELGTGLGVNAAESLVTTYAPNTTLRVRLPLPALSDPLLARVLTCERAAARGGLSVRLACEFLPLSSWEQEILIQHVFRQYREQKRSA